MKHNRFLSGLAIACLSKTLLAATPLQQPDDVALFGDDASATRAAIHLTFADRLRRIGIEQSFLVPHEDENFTPDFVREAGPMFFSEALTSWQEGAAGEFSAEQIADFFSGAQVLLGPFDGLGAVFAYFNPWWDALLVVQTKCEADMAPDGADAAFAAVPPRVEEALRVKSLEWLSGETFRGELASSPPSSRTVVPEEDPISVEIWRVQRATLAKFNDVFREEDIYKVRLQKGKIGAREIDRAAELNRIQLRAGTRLKLLSMQMKSKVAVGVAIRVGDLLRSASVVMLKRHFTDPTHEFFCETFAQLNRRAFRAGFVPYGYVPTAEGSLYVFVNRDLPRLYATVSIPEGLVDGETDKPAIFEWYDLDLAAEHLAAWEEENSKAGGGANDGNLAGAPKGE